MWKGVWERRQRETRELMWSLKRKREWGLGRWRGVGRGLAKMRRKRGPNKESIGVLQQVLEIMQASCGFLAGLLALSQIFWFIFVVLIYDCKIIIFRSDIYRYMYATNLLHYHFTWSNYNSEGRNIHRITAFLHEGDHLFTIVSRYQLIIDELPSLCPARKPRRQQNNSLQVQIILPEINVSA